MTQAVTARPLVHEVDLDALRRNHERVAARLPDGTRWICSVKANAYGHGLVPVAHALEGVGVDALATASVDEAMALRDAGSECRVVLFGGFAPDAAAELVARGITPTVANVETARALVAAGAAGAEVFVKVDCGLGRVGLAPEDVEPVVRDMLPDAGIAVAGLYTHLPFADGAGERWAREGLERFSALVQRLRAAGACIGLVQALSSPGVAAGLPLVGNAVCPGRLLYGLAPVAGDAGSWGLEPVLCAIRTQIVHARTYAIDARIGSGGRARVRAGDTVAVVPVGRSAGYLVAPGAGAQVMHRGRRAPVVGVSLEHTTVNLGPRAAAVGDEVLLLGGDVSLEELASWSGLEPLDALVVLGRDA